MFGSHRAPAGVAPPPTSAEVASRIENARTAIRRAESEIPALRAESAELEREVSDLLGRQIAEDTTMYGERIAAARARRGSISEEIEVLAAAAAVARQGIESAERQKTLAEVRETRAKANAVRLGLARDLTRGVELASELFQVSARIVAASISEHDYQREEQRLRGERGHRPCRGR